MGVQQTPVFAQENGGIVDQGIQPGLLFVYRIKCRAELIALNAERDSIQKIETRFREDVIRLAETFSKTKLSSEYLQLAKQSFEDGKIREADNMLNAQEITQAGDALLEQKENQKTALQETERLCGKKFISRQAGAFQQRSISPANSPLPFGSIPTDLLSLGQLV